MSAAEPLADLVLVQGKIVTMNPAQPTAEAMAVRGGRIAAIGTDSQIAATVGDRTRVIDLQGRLAMPGFIESHGHFVSLGETKMNLDLSTASTWDEIVDSVERAAVAMPPGTWLVGRGWHQGKWTRPPANNVQGYPVHDELSRRTPEHPVLLTHGTGHMVFANARAMQLAGITQATRAAPGGEILRKPSGEPTGAFRENAAGPIYAAHAASQRGRSADQIRNDLLTAIRLAARECSSNGVTSFHDAGTSFSTVELYRELAEQSALPVRLWAMLDEDNEALSKRMADYRWIGLGNHFLTVRSIKRLVDGAIGTHGAWLLEPYSDLPASSGHNTTTPESIRKTADLAVKHEFQLCVHAIGDRANRVVLDIFEAATQGRARDNLRWRIEHAQHIDPNDIPRFAQLKVIASMQGVHCTSDAPFVVTRLGETRARTGAYVWRSLLDHGAMVVNGTDTPVERISPIECFYASVTRKRITGEVFFPEQRMTRYEALRSYTRDAAYAAFEEDIKGTLEPGKLADIVVLSKDLLTIPDDEILSTQVLYTIVGGRVVHESGRR